MAKRAKAGAKARTVGLVWGETTGPAGPSKSRPSDTLRAFAGARCTAPRKQPPSVPLRNLLRPPRDESASPSFICVQVGATAGLQVIASGRIVR
jgi:hypothetical protein